MNITVYYQKMIKGNGCIHDNPHTLEDAILLELDELYYNDKTINEKIAIKDDIMREIKSLKVGESFETLGFEWGVMEMTREELENLEEFTGW